VKALTFLIILSLLVMGLGFAMPERFALFGVIAAVVLFVSTAALGVVQWLTHNRRSKSHG